MHSWSNKICSRTRLLQFLWLCSSHLFLVDGNTTTVEARTSLAALDYVDIDWRHVFEDCVDTDARNATFFPPFRSTARGQVVRDAFSARVSFCAVANMRCYTKLFHGVVGDQPVKSPGGQPVFFAGDTDKYELRDLLPPDGGRPRSRALDAAPMLSDAGGPTPQHTKTSTTIVERPCRVSSIFAGSPGANGLYSLLAGARHRERKKLPAAVVQAVDAIATREEYDRVFRKFGLSRFLKGVFGEYIKVEMGVEKIKEVFCPEGPADFVEEDIPGFEVPMELFLLIWRLCRPRYWHKLLSDWPTQNATRQDTVSAVESLARKQMHFSSGLGYMSSVLNKTQSGPSVGCMITDGMLAGLAPDPQFGFYSRYRESCLRVENIFTPCETHFITLSLITLSDSFNIPDENRPSV